MFALCMVELSLVHVLVLVLCSALSFVVPVLCLCIRGWRLLHLRAEKKFVILVTPFRLDFHFQWDELLKA